MGEVKCFLVMFTMLEWRSLTSHQQYCKLDFSVWQTLQHTHVHSGLTVLVVNMLFRFAVQRLLVVYSGGLLPCFVDSLCNAFWWCIQMVFLSSILPSNDLQYCTPPVLKSLSALPTLLLPLLLFLFPSCHCMPQQLGHSTILHTGDEDNDQF